MKVFDLPQGFAMKLIQDKKALQKFEALSESDKEALAAKLKSFSTRSEMRRFVNEFFDRA